MINLLIADDEERIRGGLRKRVLDFALPIGRIYEAADGRAALETLGEKPIHIALVDINMPFLNGLEFILQGMEVSPSTIFIIVSGYNSFAYAQEAIRCGVFRYLLKPVNKEELRETLTAALDLVEEEGEDTGKGAVLEAITHHIKRGYASNSYALGILAQDLGISEGYASKVLKKGTGYTFNEYLTKVRIDNAIAILGSEGRLVRVGEVAARVGFSSQHYFSAVFKKVTGRAPSDYS